MSGNRRIWIRRRITPPARGVESLQITGDVPMISPLPPPRGAGPELRKMPFMNLLGQHNLRCSPRSEMATKSDFRHLQNRKPLPRMQNLNGQEIKISKPIFCFPVFRPMVLPVPWDPDRPEQSLPGPIFHRPDDLPGQNAQFAKSAGALSFARTQKLNGEGIQI